MNPNPNEYMSVPMASIVASTTNPRGRPTDEAIEERAKSMAQVGLLQPPTLRPIEGGRLEVVIGETRWRAAQWLRWESITARVVTLSDSDAREAQLVENLQRAEIPVVQEADSLQGMLELVDAEGRPRYSVDGLAERLGKEARYVRRRLLLCRAAPAVREAVREGDIGLQTAEALARMSEADQVEALAEMAPAGGEALTEREALALVRSKWMRSLARGVPFSLDDAVLVPEAGSCRDCPKNSVNMSEGGGQGAQPMCTDLACLRAKLGAHFERVAGQLVARGAERLSEADNAAVFPPGLPAGAMAMSSPFVDVAVVPAVGLLKSEVSCGDSWRALLDRAAKAGLRVPRFVGRDQRGDARELVLMEPAMLAIEEAGEPIFRTRERAKRRAAGEEAPPRPVEPMRAGRVDVDLFDELVRVLGALLVGLKEGEMPAGPEMLAAIEVHDRAVAERGEG